MLKLIDFVNAAEQDLQILVRVKCDNQAIPYVPYGELLGECDKQEVVNHKFGITKDGTVHYNVDLK